MHDNMRGVRRRAFARVVVGLPLAAATVLGSSAVAAAAKTGNHTHHHDRAAGLVTSVNGDSTAGTCGSDTTGYFDIAMAKRDHRHKVLALTVDVSGSTTYKSKAVSSATFANVCVGDRVRAVGSYSAGTLTASSVWIATQRPTRAAGLVTSVNGDSTAGTCGSDTTGYFDIAMAKRDHRRRNKVIALTIDVNGSTTYKSKAVSSATFANVCVGDRARAVGSYSAGTLTASSVWIATPHQHKH